ncbi:unnamed protein product, partial [Oikopleura dioica]
SFSVVIEPQRGEATARGVFQFWRVSRYVDAPGARSAQRTIHKITCPGSRVRLASGPLAPRRLTSLTHTLCWPRVFSRLTASPRSLASQTRSPSQVADLLKLASSRASAEWSRGFIEPRRECLGDTLKARPYLAQIFGRESPKIAHKGR